MMPLVLEAAARSLVLGLCVWLVLGMSKSRNPHLQKTVWFGVLVASLAMPVLLWSNLAPTVEAPSYVVSLTVGDTPVASAVGNWTGFTSDPDAARLMQGIAGVYALVMLALLLRLGTGLVWMWRVRRQAEVVRAPWVGSDDIRVSGKLFGPATFGSTILLPTGFDGWSASKLAAVLCHERSHVRQRDCYVLWLARLHACLFWINPFAWLIQRRLAALAETTSDDAVVSETGDRPAYAELLLEIAGARATASQAIMAMARPNVSSRIERIISDVPPAAPAKRWHKALSIALLVPVVSISAVSLQWPALALAKGETNMTDPGEPRVVSWPDDLEKYYPSAAKVVGREGLVRIAITLDGEAHVIGTQVLQEEPAVLGFAEAAERVARDMLYANPTGNTVELKIFVRFALDEGSKRLHGPSGGHLGG
jgi:bla regulator protein blaR1